MVRFYVNRGFDTRKSGKTAEEGAKIGLSEVKSTFDSPFLTIFLFSLDRPAGKVVTLAVTDCAIIKMCEEKLKGAKHHLISHTKVAVLLTSMSSGSMSIDFAFESIKENKEIFHA